MGLFLSMTGVIAGSAETVVGALRAYAEANGGSLEAAELTTDDEGCLVISEAAAGVTVLYPDGFLGWDSASRFLSERLNKPVFSFHIHDGDLWMYLLFDKGAIVDQFNPIPDYWEKLDDAERRSWRGNASEVANRVPGLSPEQISEYLVEWGDEVLDSDEPKKAYPTDEFHYGKDWQVVDFMAKLGLDYPFDDQGLRGTTYRLKCEPPEAR